MAEAHIAKWGNSLALRLPQGLAKEVGLREGDRVSLEVTEDHEIVVRSGRPKYTLEELVNGITPKNRHRETGTGKAVGKEIW
jgi:antitoxin MazE